MLTENEQRAQGIAFFKAMSVTHFRLQQVARIRESLEEKGLMETDTYRRAVVMEEAYRVQWSKELGSATEEDSPWMNPDLEGNFDDDELLDYLSDHLREEIKP